MPEFLSLKLRGVMQSWGGHTYEELRHSEIFPTRSALLGMLAACLGIRRNETQALKKLNNSVDIIVCQSSTDKTQEEESEKNKSRKISAKPKKVTDYHTILDARTVKGNPRESITQSWREYLCDTEFTVILGQRNGADFSLQDIASAVNKPVFTPFLGRRCCPLSRPLFDSLIEADTPFAALQKRGLKGGTIYSEIKIQGQDQDPHILRIRDMPEYGRIRQFSTRLVYVYSYI